MFLQNLFDLKKNRKKGFSLVELIVVIAIMAVLIAILAPSLLAYVERSRAQKDYSAMDEVANAILLGLSDADAYDEAVRCSSPENVSCYIDTETEAGYNKIITKAATGSVKTQYTFEDDARLADETPYFLAGNMRGLTITFEPTQNTNNKTQYVLKDGVVNKFVGTKSNFGDAKHLYNIVRQAVGDSVTLVSQTYRNSEHTIFIRIGSTGGAQDTAQDAVQVYGQYSGTNLPVTDPESYDVVSDRNTNVTEVPDEDDVPIEIPADCGIDGHYADDGKEHGMEVTNCPNGHTYTCECDESCESNAWAVPDGGTYYFGVLTDKAGNYNGATETYTGGQKIDREPVYGDVYVYGDYEYRYNSMGGTDIKGGTDEYYFFYYTGEWTIDGWQARALVSNPQGELSSNINRKPLLSLNGAFALCEDMTIAPEIPNTVVYVKDAFKNTDIEITPVLPEGITNLSGTFYGCDKLKTVTNIPSTVTNVYNTFFGCQALETTPRLPEGVKNISSTFSQCINLKTVTNIPSNVTTMNGTFSGCTSLTTAPKIHEGVTQINNLFKGCTSLTEAPEIPSSVKYMSSTFEGCTNLTTAPEIPSGVTNMSSAFKNCTSLTGTITIHVTSIDGVDCFSGVDFKAQGITLDGTSGFLDYLGATGKNYCKTCNGKCLGGH